MKTVLIVVGVVLVVGAIWYFTIRKPKVSVVISSNILSKTIAPPRKIIAPATTDQSGLSYKPGVETANVGQHPVEGSNIGTPTMNTPIVPSSNGMIAQPSYGKSTVYVAPGGRTVTGIAGTQKSVTGPDWQGMCACDATLKTWAKECCTAKSIVIAGLLK